MDDHEGWMSDADRRAAKRAKTRAKLAAKLGMTPEEYDRLHPTFEEQQGARAVIVTDAVLTYVEEHPGCSVQEVIRDRTVGSRRKVEAAIKELLYQQPKRLRSEHPEGTHAFGRGAARLWLRDREEPA